MLAISLQWDTGRWRFGMETRLRNQPLQFFLYYFEIVTQKMRTDSTITCQISQKSVQYFPRYWEKCVAMKPTLFFIRQMRPQRALARKGGLSGSSWGIHKGGSSLCRSWATANQLGVDWSRRGHHITGRHLVWRIQTACTGRPYCVDPRLRLRPLHFASSKKDTTFFFLVPTRDGPVWTFHDWIYESPHWHWISGSNSTGSSI